MERQDTQPVRASTATGDTSGDENTESIYTPPNSSPITREDQTKPSIISLDKAAQNPNREARGFAYFYRYLRVKIAAVVFACALFVLIASLMAVVGGNRSAVWVVVVLGVALLVVDMQIRKYKLIKHDGISATWRWVTEELERLGCAKTYNFRGTIESVGGGFQYDAGYIAGSISFASGDKNRPVILKNVMVPSLLESVVRIGVEGRFFITGARGGRSILFAVETNGLVQEACEQARAVCVDLQSEEMRNPDSPTRRALRSPGMIVFLPVFPVLFLIPLLVKYSGAPSPLGLRRYLRQCYERA